MNKQILFFLTVLAITFAHAASVNKTAPAFSLTDSAGKEVSLQEYKGKVVFVNFWASWCAPCQIELPQLDKLAEEYAEKNVRVIAINVDKDRAHGESAIQTLKLMGDDLEILWDTKSKVVSAYDVEAMPSSYIIDQNGMIRKIHIGFHNDDPQKWRNELNSLLNPSGSKAVTQ